MKKIVFIIFLMLFLIPYAFASQEGVLRFSSFSIESEGIGESGHVLVSGELNGKNEINSLTIKAFGQTYQISKDKLKTIPKISYNGIQLSYEYGYKELGGKTIYITLHVGFNSGITKKVLLTLTEDGKFEVE